MICEIMNCKEPAVRDVKGDFLCNTHALYLESRVWEPTQFFCRHCGQKGLRVQPEVDGDFYSGPSYYCDYCKECFTMG